MVKARKVVKLTFSALDSSFSSFLSSFSACFNCFSSYFSSFLACFSSALESVVSKVVEWASAILLDGIVSTEQTHCCRCVL